MNHSSPESWNYNGPSPATVVYGADQPPLGAVPPGAVPGLSSGEWWQSPRPGVVPGPSQPMAPQIGQGGVGFVSGHRVPVARPRTAPSGLLAHRAAIAFALVLAAFAGAVSVVGSWAIVGVGAFDSDKGRVWTMTAGQLFAGVLWVVAALLLGRRVKAGRALAAALAVGYLALNVYALNSLFTDMVTLRFYMANRAGSLLVGDEPGQRILGAGVGLAVLVLVVLSVSALTGRSRSAPPAPTVSNGGPPHGYAPLPAYPPPIDHPHQPRPPHPANPYAPPPGSPY